MAARRHSRRRVLASMLGGAIAVGSLESVWAAADVRVLRSTFESHFPQSMAFSLDAAVVRPIRQVTLSYRIAGRRTISEVHAQIEQTTSLRSAVEVDLTRRYLPPGTALQYFWVVEDNQGQRFRSEQFNAIVEDHRFQWRHVRGQNVELMWYSGDDSFGRALSTIVSRALGTLSIEAGVTLERLVRILVYGDIEEFRSASYRGGLEWVGGTYYPLENVVLVYAPASQQGIEIARRAIPHELTHAILHQVTDNPFGDIPQWLNEGLASRSEPGMVPSHADALSKAIAEGKLIPLRALSGAFPVDSDEATLAYAESYSAVTFLVENYGQQRLNDLLRIYREGVTHDEGLQRALGVDMAELDREWQAWLAPWPLIKATPFSQLPTPDAALGSTEMKPPEEGIIEKLKSLANSILGRR